MKKKSFIFLSVVVMTIAIMLILVGCNNTSTAYDITKTTKMNNYELLNKSAEQEQVVFIGDSIIELFPTYEMFAGREKVVYNRGISGDTSDKMLERIEKNALNIKPQTVFILVGTNDISRGITHDITLDNISKSIDKCKTSGVEKIVISGLLPVNKNVNSSMVGRRTNKELKEFNTKLKTLTQSKNVNFYDFTEFLVDNDGNFNKDYTYDGLHPNAKGYAVISEKLMSIIFG